MAMCTEDFNQFQSISFMSRCISSPLGTAGACSTLLAIACHGHPAGWNAANEELSGHWNQADWCWLTCSSGGRAETHNMVGWWMDGSGDVLFSTTKVFWFRYVLIKTSPIDNIYIYAHNYIVTTHLQHLEEPSHVVHCLHITLRRFWLSFQFHHFCRRMLAFGEKKQGQANQKVQSTCVQPHLNVRLRWWFL